MNTRFLVTGALAAGVTLFIWSSLAHTVIPWPLSTVAQFANNEAVVESVRGATPGNGIYFAPQGILTIVSLRPDLADKTQAIGGNLALQFVTAIAVGFLLSAILLGTQRRSAGSGAAFLAVVAAAAGVELLIPDWNWYGFPAGHVASEFASLVIGWSLAGAVLGALLQRGDRRARPRGHRAADRAVVAG